MAYDFKAFFDCLAFLSNPLPFSGPGHLSQVSPVYDGTCHFCPSMFIGCNLSYTVEVLMALEMFQRKKKKKTQS